MNYNYEVELEQEAFPMGVDELARIETIIQENLIDNGVNSVLMIDQAGNIITKLDNGKTNHDMYSLAALASANYAAVDTMAKIVGEQEFSLLFHQGKKESTHFCKVNEEFLLICIFGKEITLGLLRLKISQAAQMIRDIWE